MWSNRRIVAVSVSAGVLLVCGAVGWTVVSIRNDARRTRDAAVTQIDKTGEKVREKLDDAADATKRGAAKVKSRYEQWKERRAAKKAARERGEVVPDDPADEVPPPEDDGATAPPSTPAGPAPATRGP